MDFDTAMETMSLTLPADVYYTIRIFSLIIDISRMY